LYTVLFYSRYLSTPKTAFKVFKHYKDNPNPLKLKAARFLTTNMAARQSLVPYWTDSQNKELQSIKELNYPTFEQAQNVFDSLVHSGAALQLKKQYDTKF